MESIINIGNLLGIDRSILMQLMITIFYLIIVRFVFINDLLKLLTERDFKTIGLKASADADNQAASEIMKQYQHEIDECYKVNYNELNLKKAEVERVESQKLKEKEAEISKKIAEEISNFKKELDKHTKSIDQEIENIGQLVIKKIIQ